MGTEIIILVLQIIVAVILGIMGSLKLALATISAAGVWFCLDQAFKPDAWSVWWYLAVLFALFCLLTLLSSYLRLRTEQRLKKRTADFKTRITDYIAEGQHLMEEYGGITIGTPDYIVQEITWSKKVSEDIRCHKGQVEMNLFLAEATTRVFESKLAGSDSLQEARDYADRIVATRLRQLEELRGRL